MAGGQRVEDGNPAAGGQKRLDDGAPDVAGTAAARPSSVATLSPGRSETTTSTSSGWTTNPATSTALPAWTSDASLVASAPRSAASTRGASLWNLGPRSCGRPFTA